MSTNTHQKTIWILLCATLIIVISYLIIPSSNADKKNETDREKSALSSSKSSSSWKNTELTNLPFNKAVTHNSQDQTHAQILNIEPDTVNDDVINLQEAPLPRVLSSYTQAGALLDDYLEAQDIAYLDSSFYPFDAQTESIVRQYANSGKILLFDNTEATENLLEFNKSSGDVVSDYYGTGAESSMTIATSITLANGGIEYMVLPISKTENDNDIDLSEKVKFAIELFQLEQTKKREDQVNG